MTGAKQSSRRGGHRDDEALERFCRLRDKAQQMEVVHQAVSEHGERLKRSYPNLIMVSSGFRQRRGANGAYAIYPEPCVLLTVDGKWKGTSLGTRSKRKLLPKRLTVYLDKAENHVRYDVPTDVQDMKWLADIEPQRASSIVVEAAGEPRGSITCAVKVVSSVAETWYALSALHVLSPVPPLDRLPPSGLRFHQMFTGQTGRSTSFGGSLRSDGPSFDAQLAEAGQEMLTKAFAGLPSGTMEYARSRAELDSIVHTSRFIVLVPTNLASHSAAHRPPVYGQFSGYADESLLIQYTVSNNSTTFRTRIRFAELIVIASGAGEVSQAGDSGSAVIAMKGGRIVLAGMLIAGPQPGSASDRMIILPAWTLFNPRNWAKLPLGTKALLPAF